MSDKYPGGFVTAGAPAGFSVAFDGTGDYLSTPSATALQLTAATAFTIEAWAYPTSFPNTDHGIIGKRNGGNVEWQFFFKNDKTLRFYTGLGDYGSGTTISGFNQWVHCAVTWDLTTLRFFINGVLCSTTHTGILFNTPSTADVTIGADYAASELWYGYLSNVRLVKGTALYTTTFTPPTQLFPVTNTSILACQSPTLIDNSTNNFTLTTVGDAKVSNFTPFAGYQGFNPALGAAAGGVWTIDESAYYQQNRLWPIYDPYFNSTTLMLHGNGTNAAQNNTFLDSSTNNFTITRNGNTTQGTFTPFSQTGWSNFFNGTTDYLSNTSLTNFLFTSNLSTMFATFEAWVYPTSWNNISGYGHNPLWGNNGTYATFGFYNGALQFTRGAAQTITSTGSISLNTWSHVAVTINQSTVTFYINGVNAGTGTLTAALGTRGTDFIGHQNGTGSYFAGYISNFRISTNVAYTTNFTPSTVPLIATTGTQTLTCQSNRFVDNSANNFTLTVSGTPSVQAFSPFVPAYITPTTYSNYFDGTGDYLTASGANLALGAGNFTVEGWVYLTGYNGGAAAYTGIGSYPDSTALMFYINASGAYSVNVGASDLITTGTAPLNTWIHFAVVRSSTGSNGLTLYINGISVATATSATNFTSTNAVIGRTGVSTNSNLMLGCLSNIRVLVGTALYTANFTPPTAPLTAITNTQLLTCQSSTFVDNSTNNFALTANGNVQPVTSPTPFPAKVDTTTLNSAYSTSLIGGSAYFDGTGDYLTAGTNSAFAFGTGDFTIECWIYLTGANVNYRSIVSTRSSSGSGNGWSLATDASGNIYIYSNAYIVQASSAIVPNTWYHVAVCRVSGTTTLYLNGVSRATSATARDYTDSGLAISNDPYLSSEVWQGYITGMRLVKGTAVYTAAFTPPTAPPTAITNTSLLTNFTNGAIFDNTAKNVLETAGGAALSSTQAKYGTTSMYFDGTGDCLIFPATPNFLFSGNFTIEAWFNRDNGADGSIFVMETSGANYFALNVASTGYSVYLNATGPNFSPTVTLSNNTWYHVAVVRNGSTVTLYHNGTNIGTASNSSSLGSATVIAYVGGINGGLKAYIDDLRITKTARYTTNFTPPTSQLQDQ